MELLAVQIFSIFNYVIYFLLYYKKFSNKRLNHILCINVKFFGKENLRQLKTTIIIRDSEG